MSLQYKAPRQDFRQETDNLDSTAASETEVFSIQPEPRMQMREVSSCNCAIPMRNTSTKSFRPWKSSGSSLRELLRGISCLGSVRYRPRSRSLEVEQVCEYPSPCVACNLYYLA